MECLKSLDDASKAFFAVTKSSDENIMGFYVNGLQVTLKLIKRANNQVVSTRELTVFESELIGIKLEQTLEGIPKLIFAINILDSSEESLDYYLINDPLRSGHVSLFTISSQGPAILREVFVDLESSQAYCKFQKETNEEFVDIKKVDLSILSYFTS